MYKDLAAAITSFSCVYFEGMWGNNGDRLIREASSKFLNDIGVSMTRELSKADAIVVNGGGAMTKDWGGVEVLARYAASTDLPIIVMPSSYYGGPSEDKCMAEVFRRGAVRFFCRETLSYERLNALCLSPEQIALGHDMALYLKKDDLEQKFRLPLRPTRTVLVVERRDAERSTSVGSAKPVKVPFKRLAPLWLKRPLKRALAIRRGQASELSRQVRAFLARQDGNGEHDNYVFLDISDTSLCSYRGFIRSVSGAEVIVTTRLHVAILSHILGTKCYLMATSGGYQKNERVYEQSLSESEWVEMMPAGGLSSGKNYE